jgi:tagatose 6-phosphate kinase
MVFGRLTLDAVNRARLSLDGAAGKSINVAKVLKALGEQPVATGFLGGDRGDEVRRELNAKSIESDFVSVAARTRQCVTVVDEASKAITELVEESAPVTKGAFEELTLTIQRRIRGCQAAVMSGTLAPGGPVDFYRRCTELGHQTGAISILDAQGPPLLAALLAKPALAKPNRAELAATMGQELSDEAAVIDAMRQLHERGAQRVVVTAGSGPILAFDGKDVWRLHSPKIDPVNPIGSGDAFTAGLTSHLVRGADFGEACRWGAAAGAANALTLMAGEVERPTVERLAGLVTVMRIPKGGSR